MIRILLFVALITLVTAYNSHVQANFQPPEYRGEVAPAYRPYIPTPLYEIPVATVPSYESVQAATMYVVGTPEPVEEIYTTDGGDWVLAVALVFILAGAYVGLSCFLNRPDSALLPNVDFWMSWVSKAALTAQAGLVWTVMCIKQRKFISPMEVNVGYANLHHDKHDV